MPASMPPEAWYIRPKSVKAACVPPLGGGGTCDAPLCSGPAAVASCSPSACADIRRKRCCRPMLSAYRSTPSPPRVGTGGCVMYMGSWSIGNRSASSTRNGADNSCWSCRCSFSPSAEGIAETSGATARRERPRSGKESAAASSAEGSAPGRGRRRRCWRVEEASSPSSAGGSIVGSRSCARSR